MTRLVLLIVLLWIAFELIVRWVRQNLPGDARQEPLSAGGQTPKAPAHPEAQALVRCAVCELHFPFEEVVSESSGTLYCSDGCRQAAASGPS
ncbi:MAG: hypothetical protein K0U98_07685 [Deltaproteobacteria bacterium]|nr:hypothetical protein [Deltaproteobacteria bacterium]